MPFKFVDLFAGIGGFHAALSSMGGKCVYAVEIDKRASAVYKLNWGIDSFGDITKDVSDREVLVPEHDVLVAGFPCQPFSKSGAQLGMEETRGTLYWNILKIIKTRRPALVVLENVRNLSGPRHEHEWKVIIDTLRAEKYMVSEVAGVFSPHLLPPNLGGRPQVRERVFIVAIRNDDSKPSERKLPSPVVSNQPINGWDPKKWNLVKHLPLQSGKVEKGCELGEAEVHWINAWDDFVVSMWELRLGVRLPGFPLWGDDWCLTSELKIPRNTPLWKAQHLKKNAEFYTEHKKFIDKWAKKWDFYSDTFPPSRRKLEWQAQDTPSLWETVMHFRPSGIRAKRPTYLPALVAITQTSIIGSRKRRLSTREAARLQGLPDWFDFGQQPNSATYKQLGNGVSVGAVWYVVRKAVQENATVLKKYSPNLVKAVLNAPDSPDEALKQH
jgi:DNA (cytosine-5)-methyltransferase 1